MITGQFAAAMVDFVQEYHAKNFAGSEQSSLQSIRALFATAVLADTDGVEALPTPRLSLARDDIHDVEVDELLRRRRRALDPALPTLADGRALLAWPRLR